MTSDCFPHQVRITQGDAVMREAKAAEADEAAGRRFKATITDADADDAADDDDAAPSAAMAVEAAEMMEQCRITSILVVDQFGLLCGALNTNDLMRAKVI